MRIFIGVLLMLGTACLLLMGFAFATLSAGGLERGAPEWWPTVLGAMFEAPETFILIAGMMGGVGLCLYRPGMTRTEGRLMAVTGVILLGLFLQAASREQQWMESRTPNLDGTRHVVKKYCNWFNQGRTVETDEP
ncbi:hypothetical protein [Gemmata massiliana]|nr:hypothetical protein [Gemmata massiliana]